MSGVSQSVCLVGAGAIAHALARDLTGAGWEVSCWARRPEAAPAASVALEQVAAASLVVICVSDQAVAEIAERLAQVAGPRSSPGAVLHTSGYHDAGSLAPLAAVGWSTGSLHPLRAIPPLGSDAEHPSTLVGSWFACEGDGLARDAASAVVQALSGHLVPLAGDADAKARYHAAATLAAAGSIALMDAVLAVMGVEGGGEGSAEDRLRRRALTDLAQGALENVAEVGPRAALTGPLTRGDAAVVTGHLELLRAIEGAPLDLYLELTRRALALVRERGVLSDDALAQLERAIEGARPRT